MCESTGTERGSSAKRNQRLSPLAIMLTLAISQLR